MRARRIIQAGAFDEAGVKRLQEAFEAAWEQISPTTQPAERPRLRELLATIIVAVGNVSGLDVSEMKEVALRSFNSVRAANEHLL